MLSVSRCWVTLEDSHMIRLSLLLLLTAALLVPTLASASNPPLLEPVTEKITETRSSKRVVREQFVNFTEQEFNAIRRGPTVTAFSTVGRAKFGDMLVLRKSFLPALENSGQELICKP
ncbi:MAG: hypothetical protein ACI9OJ_003229 [Myxococcota bacterium]|jgi:hypothetical protein